MWEMENGECKELQMGNVINEQCINEMKNEGYEKWELGMWEVRDVRNEECEK